MSRGEVGLHANEVNQITDIEASLIDVVRLLGGVSAETCLALSLGDVETEARTRIRAIVGHVLLHAESIRDQLNPDSSDSSPSSLLRTFSTELPLSPTNGNGSTHHQPEANGTGLLHSGEVSPKPVETSPIYARGGSATSSDENAGREVVEPAINQPIRAETTTHRTELEKLLNSLAPLQADRPRVGDTPSLTIVGDKAIRIDDTEYELDAFDTLALNLLLERQRFGIKTVRERFHELSPEMVQDFRASLHRVRSILNYHIDGAVEMVGKTRATKYGLSPSIVVADTRHHSPNGGTPDFLAQE